ncbi:MAG: SGNH/GDSL hydrolase family protein, partial [Bacteroidota bacterium]
MTTSIKYYLGAILSIPLLPILYIQSLFIRAKVPKLPEAEEEQGFFIKSPGPSLKIISIGESTVAGVGAKTHE